MALYLPNRISRPDGRSPTRDKHPFLQMAGHAWSCFHRLPPSPHPNPIILESQRHGESKQGSTFPLLGQLPGSTGSA